MNKKGFVIWFIGLSASGKTTFSQMLHQQLQFQYQRIHLIDGDLFRKECGIELGYSIKDRKLSVKIISYVARELSDQGINVIIANISPFQEIRDLNRKNIEKYIEVFLDCTIETCIKRDFKGNYKKALNGELKDFIGIDQLFEPPTNSDLVINNNFKSIQESYQKIIQFLITKGIYESNQSNY